MGRMGSRKPASQADGAEPGAAEDTAVSQRCQRTGRIDGVEGAEQGGTRRCEG